MPKKKKDNKRRVDLMERWNKAKCSRPLACWEKDISKDVLRKFATGVGISTKSKVLDSIEKFMDELTVDATKLVQMPVEDLLMEPIRTLHLGKKVEQALTEVEITHICSLVCLTPFELTKMTTLGDLTAGKISEHFGPQLKFGMEIPDHKSVEMSVTTTFCGSLPDVAAANSSMLRHQSTRIDRDEISRRTTSKVVEDSFNQKRRGPKRKDRTPKGSKSNHPFRLTMSIQCADSNLEVNHKRFRGCKDLAKKLREVADRIDGIETRKAWESSDAWITEL
jgi:hypothetical protein